jgi:hypothetical protein
MRPAPLDELSIIAFPQLHLFESRKTPAIWNHHGRLAFQTVQFNRRGQTATPARFTTQMDRNGDFNMASRGQEADPLNLRAWGRRGPSAQEMIGRRLKAHYGEIEQQNLPDNLRELLARLDEADAESRKS